MRVRASILISRVNAGESTVTNIWEFHCTAIRQIKQSEDMRSRKKKYHVRKKASISFGPYILESVGPATPFISL